MDKVFLLKNNSDIKEFCDEVRQSSFITVDTEFVRERFYWPKLCLIQIAGEKKAGAIDVLEDGVDLTPVYDLLKDETILKVFHACKQDMEIFYYAMNTLPKPFYDTQIGGMFCGFGESIGYEKLVTAFLKKNIDKSQRYTDWMKRPLTKKQLNYALSDVTYLREIYEKLTEKLEKMNKTNWVAEEHQNFITTLSWNHDPEQAWKRVKTNRWDNLNFSVFVRLAQWREKKAQEKDCPRKNILSDQSILELAKLAPVTVKELGQIRNFRERFTNKKYQADIIDQILKAKDEKIEFTPPKKFKRSDWPSSYDSIMRLLRCYLKSISEKSKIAEIAIATKDDLQVLIKKNTLENTILEKGWRYDLFGKTALKIRRGELSVFVSGDDVEIKEV